MLNAVKEDLKKLAVSPSDPFHALLRRRIGKKATALLESRLRHFVLMMPGLLHRIHEHWRQPGASGKARRLGGFVFAYLYNPKDFLAEDEYGFFGYLDDAYLVALVFEKVMYEERDTRFHHTEKEDRELLNQIASTKRYVKAVIPEETRRIEAMTESAIRDGKYEAFASAFGSAA